SGGSRAGVPEAEPRSSSRAEAASSSEEGGSLGGAGADRHGLDGALRDNHPESRLEVALGLGQSVHGGPYCAGADKRATGRRVIRGELRELPFVSCGSHSEL